MLWWLHCLGRKYEEEGFLFALFFLMLEWLEEAQQEWITNATISKIIK